MEVPSESFYRSSWDSRTCYPSRATDQGLTNNGSLTVLWKKGKEVEIGPRDNCWFLHKTFTWSLDIGSACGTWQRSSCLSSFLNSITFHIQHMHSTTKPDVAITFQCRPDVCFINNSFLLPQVGSTVYDECLCVVQRSFRLTFDNFLSLQFFQLQESIRLLIFHNIICLSFLWWIFCYLLLIFLYSWDICFHNFCFSLFSFVILLFSGSLSPSQSCYLSFSRLFIPLQH